MFRKTNKNESAVLNNGPKKPVPSVLSSELHILGNLVSDGHIDVDGTVDGNIKAAQVTVRPNGKVSGDIIAEAIHVYGEVHGLLRAMSVHLYSSCRIEGIIMHQSLTVEDGAFIDAKFKRLDRSSNALEGPGGESETSMSEDEDGFLESKPMNNLRLIG